MAEYIEREAVIKKLNEIGNSNPFADWKRLWDTAIDTAVKAVEKLPAANVASAKHGKWRQVDKNKCECSNCNIITLIAVYPHGDKNYCPTAVQKWTVMQMPDLIDRNAMLKTLENSGVLGEFAKYLIKKQPAVDAVEVVRCKDCKHYKNSPNVLCYLHTEP